MVASSFIAQVIESNKDFDAAFIRETIVSKINLCDFSAIIDELEAHVSGNEMNGARYAIQVMEEVA
jgi:hypothetical protein